VLSNEPKMNSVHCPYALKGGLKNTKQPFLSKIALYLKKVCYKVSLCEYCQQQSLAYLSMQKWFAGNILYYVNIWLKLTNPLQTCRFPINIRS